MLKEQKEKTLLQYPFHLLWLTLMASSHLVGPARTNLISWAAIVGGFSGNVLLFWLYLLSLDSGLFLLCVLCVLEYMIFPFQGMRASVLPDFFLTLDLNPFAADKIPTPVLKNKNVNKMSKYPIPSTSTETNSNLHTGNIEQYSYLSPRSAGYSTRLW